MTEPASTSTGCDSRKWIRTGATVSQVLTTETQQREFSLVVKEVDSIENQIADLLTATGLDGDEALLLAVKRMGSLDALSLEFAKEHSEHL